MDGDVEGDNEEEGETDGDSEGDNEDDGDNEGDVEGDNEEDGARSVNNSHESAPSSPLVPPVQVIVAAPAVVLDAVVNRNPPTSASMSPVALAHVFATVSVAHAATAKNPPPVPIVTDPVVNGAEASISVELWEPADA